MVKQVNAFDTYTAVGNREDLSNVIYNISPSDTPVMSAIGTTSAKAVKHEWQKDTLAAPGANAQLEGDVVSPDVSTPTTRLDNICQIFRKTASVTGTQEKVNKAGRTSELAYQMAKRMKEMKLDIELAILQNQAKVAGSATVARKMAGILSWLKTNTSHATDGADPTAATGAYARTAGTARLPTEDMITDVMQSCYTNGGKPTMMVVSPKMKGYISANFIGGVGSPVTTYRQQASKTAGNVVEVYQTDFGLLDIVPDRVMVNATSTLDTSKNIFLLDPKMFALAWLRPIFREDLAKTGDAKNVMLTAECTLEARNEASSGVIADVDTAVTPPSSGSGS